MSRRQWRRQTWRQRQRRQHFWRQQRRRRQQRRAATTKGVGATEGVAATAVHGNVCGEYLEYVFFHKFISYVASYVNPIQTAFLMTFQKSYGGKGIVFPLKKHHRSGKNRNPENSSYKKYQARQTHTHTTRLRCIYSHAGKYSLLSTFIPCPKHPLANKLFDMFSVNHGHGAKQLWPLPWHVA